MTTFQGNRKRNCTDFELKRILGARYCRETLLVGSLDCHLVSWLQGIP